MAKKKQTSLVDKEIELALLVAHPKNPNIHPIDQVAALAESMEKYGQYYRIIVDENNQILCGHGKKMALEHKGETTAKVTVITGLSEKEKMKLLIEDNKIQSLSYTNYEGIENIIKEIGDTDIIGFPADYLSSIVSDNNIDNMGVDFNTKAEVQQAYSAEKQEDQHEELKGIDEGMQVARTMSCPHCGGELTL